MNVGTSDKSGSEWAEGEVSVSKVDPCVTYLWEASNVKFIVVCYMQEMDQWKMPESKEGDPKIGKRFCMWKMQAS